MKLERYSSPYQYTENSQYIKCRYSVLFRSGNHFRETTAGVLCKDFINCMVALRESPWFKKGKCHGFNYGAKVNKGSVYLKISYQDLLVEDLKIALNKVKSALKHPYNIDFIFYEEFNGNPNELIVKLSPAFMKHIYSASLIVWCLRLCGYAATEKETLWESVFRSQGIFFGEHIEYANNKDSRYINNLIENYPKITLNKLLSNLAIINKGALFSGLKKSAINKIIVENKTYLVDNGFLSQTLAYQYNGSTLETSKNIIRILSNG